MGQPSHQPRRCRCILALASCTGSVHFWIQMRSSCCTMNERNTPSSSANTIQDGLPEAIRLFEQSHVDPAFFARRHTPADIVALMDASGISKICLTAWYRPGKVIFSNEQVAEFTRAFPDRFVGIAGVDLLDPVGAVRDIEKYVKEEGFKGVRVVPWLWALPPTDRH
jgi:predicted TIM-barrel fold metal-dependent hydrolase